MDYLGNLKRTSARRTAINNLPSELYNAYERIFESISQIQDNLLIVRKVVIWLLCAVRPLTLSELATVVAIDSDDDVIDNDKKLDEEEILLDTCTSLIKYNPITRVVELGHFTVREFLLSKVLPDGSPNIYFIDTTQIDAELCKTCITYLMSPPFDQLIISQQVNQLERLFARNPFLFYATLRWPDHARRLSYPDPLPESHPVLRFFLSGIPFETWSHLWQLALSGSLATSASEVLQTIAGLKSYQSCIDRLAQREATVYGLLPSLYYACLFQFSGVAKSLISRGADVNAPQPGRFHPIIVAAEAGNLKLVSKLIEAGAEINVQETSPREDSWGLYDEITENALRALNDLFIDKDHSHRGRTALIAAAKGGHENIVKILLDAGAEVDAKDDLHITALYYAAERGFAEIIQHLLERGAIPNRYYVIMGKNALLAATEGEHKECVRILLHAHKKLNQEISDLNLPLGRIRIGPNSIRSRLESVQQLMDNDGPNNQKMTVKFAAREAILTVATLLLENIQVEMKDHEKAAALQLAARERPNEIAWVILDPMHSWSPLFRKLRRYIEYSLLRALNTVDETSIKDLITDLLDMTP